MNHACPACGASTTKAGRCTTCARPENTRKAQRPTMTQVYNTARWRVLRAATLKRCSYTCQRCGAPATHAAHRTPFVDGNDPKAWDPANVEAQCATCNGREAGLRRHAAGAHAA